MAKWESLPGETPIEDVSGLKVKSIKTRGQLAVAEAQNIRKVVVKYLGSKPNRRIARFDLSWSRKPIEASSNRSLIYIENTPKTLLECAHFP